MTKKIKISKLLVKIEICGKKKKKVKNYINFLLAIKIIKNNSDKRSKERMQI